jgi:hypothetical protein
MGLFCRPLRPRSREIHTGREKRPGLAQTLNNLGILYGDTHRFADAEAAYKESVGIERELVAQNPAAYRPDLAMTLNNLASLYRDMHRDSDAEAAKAEALAAKK